MDEPQLIEIVNENKANDTHEYKKYSNFPNLSKIIVNMININIK